MSKSENIALYKYLTRPSKVDGRTTRGIDFERRGVIKKILERDIEDFNKNRKLFPNEKYSLNFDNIQNLVKQQTGTLPSIDIINESSDMLDQNLKSNLVKNPSGGVSNLTQKQKEFFAKNLKSKSLSQMSEELSGGDYTTRENKAMYQKILRYKDSLIKQNTLTPEDFEAAKGTQTGLFANNKNLVKNKKETFGAYRQAQENLMKLDPKAYPEDLKPSTLDSRLRTRTKLTDVRAATQLLPENLLASLEHYEGLVPGTIIQDPGALTKVGLTSRKYNFQIMGAKAKGPYKGRYKKVKNYLRTAKEELRLGNKKEANLALKEVNKVYSDLVNDFPTLKRTELPDYKLKGNNIVEKNLKEVIKPQTFQKSFDQYFRNIAGVATEKELERIRKVQPNVGEVLDLYRQGENKKAKELISKRIPEITEMTTPNQGGGRLAIKPGQAGLFAEAIPGSKYASEFLQGFANDVMSKKYGKAALKGLGIAGAAYGVYDTGVAFKEGKSAPEMATRFVGLDIPYQKLRQYNRLTDQEQEIQKKINQQKSFDVAADDLLDENLMTMRARPEVSQQEVMQLEQAKQRVDTEVAAEEAERASSRKGLVESLKQKIYDVTGTPYELYMNRGGRVQLAEGGDPKNLGRRKFIKGAATIAVALPFLKFIKPLSKAVEPTIEAVSRSANQMPDYLTNLINKVKMMGESKIIGKMDSPDEFMRYDLGDYELYEGAGGARLKKIRDRGDYGYEEFEMQIKQDPETGYIEYEEVSARPDGDGKIKDFDFGIEDDVHLEMKKFADEK
jgi:hypothetical protein